MPIHKPATRIALAVFFMTILPVMTFGGNQHYRSRWKAKTNRSQSAGAISTHINVLPPLARFLQLEVRARHRPASNH